MLSADEFFLSFLAWFKDFSGVSTQGLEASLDEFGGVAGVIEDSLYISACEALAATLVRESEFYEVMRLLNEPALKENGEYLYYFVESLIDHSVARGDDVKRLVLMAPENYRVFLCRRFSV
ncbi:hypothetical protein [Pseudomonas sp. NPDC089406]|uniref:hypothetical protein n=1 Tax=Pseudomonas sp. NPDC089406 TaxID=3364463 RepID=UPI00384B748C